MPLAFIYFLAYLLSYSVLFGDCTADKQRPPMWHLNCSPDGLLCFVREWPRQRNFCYWGKMDAWLHGSLPRAESAPEVLRGLLWTAHWQKETASCTALHEQTPASSPHFKPLHPCNLDVPAAKESKARISFSYKNSLQVLFASKSMLLKAWSRPATSNRIPGGRAAGICCKLVISILSRVQDHFLASHCKSIMS